MKIDGACHCGKIAFEAEIDLEDVKICHCSDCQTLSASAFRTVAPTLPGAFTLLRGEPKIYVKVAESGNHREQAFCGDCGAGLYAATVGGGERVYNLRVGAVTQRDQLIPTMQVWHRSAQPWLAELAQIEKVAKQ
ncbi:MAG: GFA family protein [Pseudomonadota bacterium]